MWEQNPSPYYLNKQIVVLWIIRDTTCRKNCYPSKMATIKVVPLSSLGLSSPLLTFGCHFFSFAKRLPWFAMYSIYYCPNGGYLFFFLKKTNKAEGICSFTCENENTLPFTIPKKRKLCPYQQAAIFFIIILFSTHGLFVLLFSFEKRSYPAFPESI